MRRLLIVNADDLGLHEDINRGIYFAHTQGIVTSASIVACGAAFDHAVEIIQECPKLDVGVHLTLVEERPVCPPDEIPTLVGPNRHFLPSFRQLTARMLMGLVSPTEVRRELEAQIKRVIDTGRQPSHLDSHQHVHLLPPVWRVTNELARQYGIRWVRVPHFQSLISSKRSPLDSFFRLGLNVLSMTMAGLSDGTARRIRTTGLHLSGKLSEHDLSQLITELHTGISEIVTHPGVTTQDLTARYHWNYEWSMELAVLTSSRIMSALHSNGILLTRFSDC